MFPFGCLWVLLLCISPHSRWQVVARLLDLRLEKILDVSPWGLVTVSDVCRLKIAAEHRAMAARCRRSEMLGLDS